jgi:hypothetical protein
MKKLMMISILSLIPTLGFAKVSDFNAMITENAKAQTELHKSIETTVDTSRIAARTKLNQGEAVLVEASGASYNVATKKDLLTFEKERTHDNVNQKQQFERLATEVQDSDF